MNYYQEHQAEFLEGLKTFCGFQASARFPSKTGYPARAEFARNELLGAGMTSAELIEDANGGNPLVYGEWLGAPGSRRCCSMVITTCSAGSLDEWKSPPFEPTIRGNDIFLPRRSTTRDRSTFRSKPSRVS